MQNIAQDSIMLWVSF